MILPCLSVRQPWATLIVAGIKDIENRTWSTNYRGPAGIHSSSTMTDREFMEACEWLAGWIPKFSAARFRADKFPLGQILGTITITGCVEVSRSVWFQGPYGFVLEDAKRFVEPIPAKGRLGFWNYELPDNTVMPHRI